MFSRAFRYACLLSISIFIASPTLAQEEPIKVGVVNLDAVLAESSTGKALQSRLEEFREETIAGSKELETKARELKSEIEKGTGSLPNDTLVGLRRQLEDATIRLRRYQEEKQREGQKIRAEGLNEIEKELQPVLQELQTEIGYDLILSSRTGVVLWAGERVDITPAVLERLK